MRKRIPGFLFCLLLSFAICAQQKGKQLAATLTDRIAVQLQLDSVQKKKVQAANEQYINELTESLQKGDRQERMQELKNLRNQHEAALQAILTKEQQKQYETLREEQKEKFSEAVAQKLSDEVTLQMQDKLNLSVKQSTQADSINNKSFQVLLSSLLNEDQRGLQKLRAIRQITEERDAAMKKILSDEQYKGYLKMNEEAKAKMQEKMRERKNG